MSLGERITRAAYEKLERENERLQAELRQERRNREAAEQRLSMLDRWIDTIVAPVVNRVATDTTNTRAVVERMSSTMSEQYTQLEGVLGQVEGIVGTLAQSVQNESQQLQQLLERLNNENPRVDLGPAIARLENLRNAVETANTQITSLVSDEEPAPPNPEPEPGPEPGPAPEPAPGQRRR